MPGKSRRSRVKHSSQSRKKRGLGSSTRAVQQPAATQTYEPVAPSQVAAPSASVPTSMPTPAAAQHPFVATELRRIGILAGIMLITLVVLALILS